MEVGNNNQGGGTRRIWSIHEEQVLMLAFKDLVAHGSDNDFRNGYLVRCENAMKVAFPNTDLLAVPHITSNIIAWKKSYGNVLTAQSSGVGFNTMTSELDCIDEQWEGVLRES
ncbi:hypothetical protein ACS0TY_025966 [Phlomoides rotata]